MNQSIVRCFSTNVNILKNEFKKIDVTPFIVKKICHIFYRYKIRNFFLAAFWTIKYIEMKKNYRKSINSCPSIWYSKTWATFTLCADIEILHMNEQIHK